MRQNSRLVWFAVACLLMCAFQASRFLQIWKRATLSTESWAHQWDAGGPPVSSTRSVQDVVAAASAGGRIPQGEALLGAGASGSYDAWREGADGGTEPDAADNAAAEDQAIPLATAEGRGQQSSAVAAAAPGASGDPRAQNPYAVFESKANPGNFLRFNEAERWVECAPVDSMGPLEEGMVWRITGEADSSADGGSSEWFALSPLSTGLPVIELLAPGERLAWVLAAATPPGGAATPAQLFRFVPAKTGGGVVGLQNRGSNAFVNIIRGRAMHVRGHGNEPDKHAGAGNSEPTTEFYLRWTSERQPTKASLHQSNPTLPAPAEQAQVAKLPKSEVRTGQIVKGTANAEKGAWPPGAIKTNLAPDQFGRQPEVPEEFAESRDGVECDGAGQKKCSELLRAYQDSGGSVASSVGGRASIDRTLVSCCLTNMVVHYPDHEDTLLWLQESPAARETLTPPEATTSSPNPRKFFVAASLRNAGKTMPMWWHAMVHLARALVAENGEGMVFVSVYEDGSTDSTQRELAKLKATLKQLGIPHNINFDAKEEATDRIDRMGAVRDRALADLDATFDLVIFLNDVSFTAEDVMKLVHTDAPYDMVCGLDHHKEPVPANLRNRLFYDVWVGRDLDGGMMQREYPFFSTRFDQLAVASGAPIPVGCCWNGGIVARASIFTEAKVHFRRATQDDATGECDDSECSVFCRDLIKAGYGRIYVNPAVWLGYKYAGRGVGESGARSGPLPNVPQPPMPLQSANELRRRSQELSFKGRFPMKTYHCCSLHLGAGFWWKKGTFYGCYAQKQGAIASPDHQKQVIELR